MTSKREIANSLINTAQATVNHINPEVAPVNYIDLHISPIVFVCPAVDIVLILDSKNKILSDIIVITDDISVSVTKNLVETISIVNEIIVLGVNKGISDSVNPVEAIGLNITKPLTENIVASDQILAHTNMLINDALLNSHAFLQGADREFVDNIVIRLN